MMTKYSDKMPVFAPYKVPVKISGEVLSCATALQIHSTEDLITHNSAGLSVHDADGEFTRYLNLKSNDYKHKIENGQEVPDGKASFRSVNLTYLPQFSESLQQQFFVDRNGTKKAFLFWPEDNWHWRSDLQVDPIKEFVNGLKLEHIHLVRLIFLNPPAVGGIHIDASPSSMQKYYDDRNGVSLTFNLQSGDGRLFFRPKDDVLQIDPSLEAWHFNPSVPHAVGEVLNPRVQLRVFGSLDRNTYLERLDLESSV